MADKNNTHSLDIEESSSQYAYGSDSASLSITGDISFGCWAKPEELPGVGEYGFFIGKWNPGDDKRSYAMFLYNSSGTQLLQCYYSSDGTAANSCYLSTPITLSTTEWTHLMCTMDVSAQGVKLYVNGVDQGGTPTVNGTPTSINDNDSLFTIGGRLSSGTPGLLYDGKIDNAVVFDKILTQDEVREYMGQELTGSETNFVEQWKLNNDYTSTSGNNDLTASGSPTFSTDTPSTLYFDNPANWTSQEMTFKTTDLSLSGDLTDYPLLIKDDVLPSAFYTGVESDGKDIRVSLDSEGRQELPTELVMITSGSELMELWTKIPTVDYDGNMTFYVWYANSEAGSYADNYAFGAENVWRSEFKAVYHLQSLTEDSTSNTRTLTNSNTVGIGAGKIQSGADYGTTNTNKKLYSSASHGISGNGNVSISLWAKARASNPEGFGQIGFTTGNNIFALEHSSTNFHIQRYTPSASSTVDLNKSNTPSQDNFQFYVAEYDGDNNQIKASIDGGSFSTQADTATGSGSGTYSDKLDIGLFSSYSWGDWYLDEFRLYSGALSADWVKADYEIQNSPTTYLEVVSGSSSAFLNLI